MSDHTPPRAASPPSTTPPLRGRCLEKTPHLPACLPCTHVAAELYGLQCTAVFQVVLSPGLMPHQETRPFGGKLAACTSSNFWSFSSARSTPHAFACSRPGANRNLRDSRSPSYASWERRAPGNTSPAVDCPPILPDMGGLPGRSNLPVGRAPHTSSQADDLQLFIIGAQPARNRRTRTQVPRHHRRRGGVGNLRIVQLFLHCPSCEPGSLKGGGLDLSELVAMIHKGDLPDYCL